MIIKTITTAEQYANAMAYIEPYLAKGFASLTEQESAELHRVSMLIHDYQTNNNYLIPK
jgi:hypothetical protein